MAYTKTTSTSYGSRLGSSFKGIFSGIILFIAATILLWWNEGRAVRQYDNIAASQKECQHVDDVSKKSGSIENCCIHATAEVKTDDILTLENDPLGVSINAVKYEREVEYYQYEEHTETTKEDKIGGKEETTTTYTYEKTWTSSPVDSKSFEDPAYKNVNSIYYQLDDAKAVAKNVTFGAYKLSDSFISSISGTTDTDLKPDMAKLKDLDSKIAQLKGNYAANVIAAVDAVMSNDSTSAESEAAETIDLTYVHIKGNVVYIGRNEAAPEIGDVRITYTQVDPGTFSLIGKVVNGEIQANKTDKGTFSMINRGNVAMEDMFKSAEESNNIWTWVLRIVGILLVIGGLKSMFGFFVTLLKVLPFLSNIADVASSIVCSIVGIVWSFIVIAIAWLFYHPLIALCILVPVAVGIFFLIKMSKDKKKAAAAAEA